MPHPRNGSKPARGKSTVGRRPQRAEFFAPPILGFASPTRSATLAIGYWLFGSEPKASYRSLLPGAYPPGFVTGLRCRQGLTGSGQRRLQVIEHDSNRYLQVLLAKIGLGHGKTAGFK